MKTTMKPTAQLVPADYNPRVELTPADDEYIQLRTAIETFGLVEPLVWNKRSGQLVGGHQRLNVLLDLGWDEAPVVEVDLDEHQERALNVALNKITGRWDDQKLLTIIDSLADAEWDLMAAGFTDDDHIDLMRRIDQSASTDFLDDLVDDDAETKAEADDVDPADHVPEGFDQAWYSMSFSVTSDERQVILAAIRLARTVFGVETSPKALLHMSEEFITQHEEDEDATEAKEQDADGDQPAAGED